MKIPFVHGHRGCRGLMPENTIPGFLHAIELGCRALEMDVVISGDKKVVVSHEPYISRVICTDINNKPLPEEKDKELNLYKMKMDAIQLYDCGSRVHPGFLQQQKMKTHKPTLVEVIGAVNKFCAQRSIDPIFFNIEIKSKEGEEGRFQPNAEEFSKLVVDVIVNKDITNHCLIQSFDFRILKSVNRINKDIKLAYLTKEKPNVDEVIELIGFKPDFLSPHFSLISKVLIADCHKQKIGVLAWTVNEESDIKQMINLNVEAIISDYPDKVFTVLNDSKMNIE